MTTQGYEWISRAPRLKATFKDAPLNVDDVSDYLHNLQAFVDVSVAMSPPVVRPTEFRLHNAIVRTHVSLPLTRVSYNSPLEVVFVIGSSVTGLAVAADRVVSVFIKWEEWKLKRAAAQDAKDDAALKSLKTQFLKAQYEDVIASAPDQGFPESKAKTHAALKRIRSAEQFLDSIDTLEID